MEIATIVDFDSVSGCGLYLGDQPFDHLWVEDILEVSVRARYDVSGARGRGDPQHGHRFLECARPVVQTWQDMAVDIDHAGAKLKLHSLELAVERFPLDSKNLRGLTF